MVSSVAAEKSVSDRLVELLQDGKLTPITKIKCLNSFAPSTRCRLAFQGKLPAIRVGAKILTSEELCLEALKKLASAPPAPVRSKKHVQTVTAQTPERLAQIAQARANNLKRGLPG